MHHHGATSFFARTAAAELRAALGRAPCWLLLPGFAQRQKEQNHNWVHLSRHRKPTENTEDTKISRKILNPAYTGEIPGYLLPVLCRELNDRNCRQDRCEDGQFLSQIGHDGAQVRNKSQEQMGFPLNVTLGPSTD